MVPSQSTGSPQTLLERFSPLYFLASVGAGGISIIPFAILQYTAWQGKGLVTFGKLSVETMPTWQQAYVYGLSAIMIAFIAIHVLFTLSLVPKLFAWMQTPAYPKMRDNPNSNPGLLTPLISFTMSMNVIIGPSRFFYDALDRNLQAFMLPAFAVWSVLWVAIVLSVIKLLKIAFVKEFDVRNIHFGWLLHPFALSMLAVTGTGIAAMSKTPWLADSAAFLSLVPMSMAVFLLIIKLVTLFSSHFHAKGLPEKQFMPSFLSVVPIITLLAIGMFRIGHYLEHRFAYHLDSYFFFVIIGAFAFQTWYMIFGLSMLKSYLSQDFFKKEYYVTQWALVCPFVAYAVMAAFAAKAMHGTPVFLWLSLASTVVVIALYGKLLGRHLKCRHSFSVGKPQPSYGCQ